MGILSPPLYYAQLDFSDESPFKAVTGPETQLFTLALVVHLIAGAAWGRMNEVSTDVYWDIQNIGVYQSRLGQFPTSLLGSTNVERYPGQAPQMLLHNITLEYHSFDACYPRAKRSVLNVR